MQKIIEFREASSSSHRAGNISGSPSVPSIEPIYAVVDSLSRTLECIKSMAATVPSGPMRDRLEIERTNLVIGLFVARIAAMRVTATEPAPETLAEPNLPMASSG
jgi:hypothetical protein